MQTESSVVDMILEMFDLNPRDVLYDLGCGHAGVLIAAAEKHNGIKCVGIEINPTQAESAKYYVKESGFEDRIEIIEGDVLDDSFDISHADAVYIYLMPYGIRKLRPKLESQLKPSCRVISNRFHIGDWKYAEKKKPPGSVLYLYRM